MYAFVLIFLAVCTVSDIKSRTVPNELIVVGICGCISFRLVENGAVGAFVWLLCFVLIQLPMSLLWIVGGFGAADIKLMAIILASISYEDWLYEVWFVLIFAAVFSLYSKALRKMACIPFVPAIFAGTAVYMLVYAA